MELKLYIFIFLYFETKNVQIINKKQKWVHHKMQVACTISYILAFFSRNWLLILQFTGTKKDAI